MRCYVCNKELVEQPLNDGQCKAHDEHIIHNGIRGKLTSHSILCEECGCKYSQEDAKFCKIFAPFIASLGNRLIPADHGKNNKQTMLGVLYESPAFADDTSSRKVSIKDNQVIPIEPYYEISGDHLTVYAGKQRINDCINVLAKEFNTKGININDYVIERVTDLHDRGFLAYYFSEGNDSFNEDFKKGLVKIATEYALNCGVSREQLKSVLVINADATSFIDYDNAIVFPFIPTTPFDILYEEFRYKIEDGYPSHSLILFSSSNDKDKTSLFCYIDLFSTFQYYVLLNDNYNGEGVNQMYAQRLLPKSKELPDVTHMRPKELSIIIQEYKIDMSKCPGQSYQEQVNYVQNFIATYPRQTYNYQASIGNACERLQRAMMLILSEEQMKSSDVAPLKQLLNLEGHEELFSSMKNTVKALTEGRSFIENMMLCDSFSESVTQKSFRVFGYDVIDSDILKYSTPIESIKLMNNNKVAAQEYTKLKFSHLSCFCFNPSAEL